MPLKLARLAEPSVTRTTSPLKSWPSKLTPEPTVAMLCLPSTLGMVRTVLFTGCNPGDRAKTT